VSPSSSTTPVFDALRDALRRDEPVVLATVTAGDGVGAKLLVGPGREPLGTLGHADLDRVVTRDALGALASGSTTTRHYGRHARRARPTSPCSSSRSRRPRAW
jgi:xanthine dehydrogenase accessory factor